MKLHGPLRYEFLADYERNRYWRILNWHCTNKEYVRRLPNATYSPFFFFAPQWVLFSMFIEWERCRFERNLIRRHQCAWVDWSSFPSYSEFRD